MPVLVHFTYSQLCVFFSDKMSQLYLCGQQSYLSLAPHPPCSQKHVLIFLFYTERDIARNCLGMQKNILCIVHHDSNVKAQHWGRVEVGRVLSTTEVSQRICDNLKSLWLCLGVLDLDRGRWARLRLQLNLKSPIQLFWQGSHSGLRPSWLHNECICLCF